MVRTLLGVCLRHTLELGKEGEQFADLHSFVQPAFLRQIPNAVEVCLLEWLAEHPDLAAIGHSDADHHANRRSLPGAIRAKQAVNTAARNLETERIDGGEAVVALGNAAQFQSIRHRRSSERRMLIPCPGSHRSMTLRVRGPDPELRNVLPWFRNPAESRRSRREGKPLSHWATRKIPLRFRRSRKSHGSASRGRRRLPRSSWRDALFRSTLPE